MLLFVIFDEKNIRIRVWFSCNSSGFLAIGTYIVTYGAGEKSCCQWCLFSYLWCYCFWCNLVTKSKSSCQWCTLAFGAVTAGYKRINWIREVDNENDEIFSPCLIWLHLKQQLENENPVNLHWTRNEWFHTIETFSERSAAVLTFY